MAEPLPDRSQGVPAVDAAADGSVEAGTVYVTDGPAADGTYPPRYRGEQKAILKTAGGRFELRTAAEYRGMPSVAGTYLDEADWLKLADPSMPTIQRYRWRDSLRKSVSGAGVLLLAPALAGVSLAVIAVVFGLGAKAGTSSTTVADRAQQLAAWVAAPAGRIDASARPATLARVRAEILHREQLSTQCLQELRGGEGAASSVGGVSCTGAKPSWWRNKDHSAYFTLAAGILMALLALVGTINRFGFGKSPRAG